MDFNILILSVILSWQLSLVTCQNKVFLLSLDGFRWDYVSKYKEVLPNLHKIINQGVYLENGIVNNFVTATFPDHRSIETGLYVESHGIIANKFWMPREEKFFVPWNLVDEDWSDAKPMWTIAEENNITAGCFNIVGCDIESQKPTHTMGMGYADSYSLRSIINNATSAMKTTDNPAQLTLSYHPEPDATGHDFGPDSEEMKAVLAEIDVDLGYLKKEIDSFDEDIDLIITADHGFSQIVEELTFDNYVTEENTAKFKNRGSVLQIWVDTMTEEELVEKLIQMKRNLTGKINVYSTMKHYHKLIPSVPQRWHYSKHQYIPPIIIVCEPGYRFIEEGDSFEAGDHGYDNIHSEMHPIFVGYGPSFAKGYRQEQEVLQVDIYPLIAHIVGFPPAPNNGSLERAMRLTGTSAESLKLCSIYLFIMFAGSCI